MKYKCKIEPEEVIQMLRKGRAGRNKFPIVELWITLYKAGLVDMRTYRKYKAVLVRLGYVESHKRHVVLTPAGRAVAGEVLTSAPPPNDKYSCAVDVDDGDGDVCYVEDCYNFAHCPKKHLPGSNPDRSHETTLGM